VIFGIWLICVSCNDDTTPEIVEEDIENNEMNENKENNDDVVSEPSVNDDVVSESSVKLKQNIYGNVYQQNDNLKMQNE